MPMGTDNGQRATGDGQNSKAGSCGFRPLAVARNP
jgi:hypothetical protein